MTEKEKAKAYDKALEKAKYLHEAAANDGYEVHVKTFECLFPELAEPEDERIRKTIINTIEDCSPILSPEVQKRMIAWLEKQGEQIDKGEISDGYHTFNELYYYRMLYNAAFFNLLPKEWTHKSKRHHDGEECFGGGWFIVMANLPTGQISNHYELKDWDLFQISEKEMADEWDGHTPQEAAERLHKYLEKQAPKPKWSEEDEKCIDNCCLLIGAADNCYEKTFKDDCIHYLQNLKKRMGI